MDSKAFKVWSTALAIMLVIIWLTDMFFTLKGVVSGRLLGLRKGWKEARSANIETNGGPKQDNDKDGRKKDGSEKNV